MQTHAVRVGRPALLRRRMAAREQIFTRLLSAEVASSPFQQIPLMSPGQIWPSRKSFEMVGDGYYRHVSNPPFPPESSAPPPWAASPTTHRRSPQLLLITSLAIALLALGVAIGSWFRPAPDNKPTPPPPAPAFNGQQVADAKAKVCAAYDRIHHAVLANTGRNGGSDPASVLGLAANARLALYDGGQYLMKTLAQQPATPADLATAVRALVDAYQELAVNYMAEAPDAEIQSSFQTLDATGSKVSGMCT
jgi:hypothetical protein